MAAYSQSLLLKVLIRSNYFASEKPEETVEFLVLQHKQNGKYSFAIPDFPKMSKTYQEKMEEKWSDIHRQQRAEHFEELQKETSDESFEYQEYVE